MPAQVVGRLHREAPSVGRQRRAHAQRHRRTDEAARPGGDRASCGRSRVLDARRSFGFLLLSSAKFELSPDRDAAPDTIDVTRQVYGITAAEYRVAEIADARPLRFPGFDRLIVDRVQLQALTREHRYTGWRTALASVKGIYLIADTRDGRQYVGKADGAETILQRWSEYATTGHGGNVELRGLDPATFRYSILRVFDPATPTRVIDEAESHCNQALDTRKHGLNRN